MGGGTKSTTTQSLSPEQRQLMALVIPEAKDIMKNTPELYPGSSISGFNPLQTQAQQTALNTTGSIGDLVTGAAGATQLGTNYAAPQGLMGTTALTQQGFNAMPAQNFMLSGALLDPNTNPVLQAQTAAALRPIEQSLTQRTLPAIQSQAIMDGGLGGSRQGVAEGLAMQEYLKQAGDISTNLQANNFNQGLGAMMNSTNQAFGGMQAGAGQNLNFALQTLLNSPNAAQSLLMPAEVTAGVGEQQRALEQAQLSETANRYFQEQIMPFLIAQDVANMAFGMGGGSATTSSSTGAGSQIMQGIGAIAPYVAMAFMSDARVKTDVKRVGQTDDGLPIYTYRIHGAGPYMMGVMAQELEQVIPSAVTEIDGIKRVDYSQV